MSFLTQQEADKIIEERTHEEVYKEFKEALLNILGEEYLYSIPGFSDCSVNPQREISLEDVLIAVPFSPTLTGCSDTHIYFEFDEFDYKVWWKLGLPASFQSDETLIAITNLLK